MGCLVRVVSVVGLLALVSLGLAQRVVFASDRLSPLERPQSELYEYRDGSELRLTATPDRSEYDPTPSPGGLIAYAETDFVPGASPLDAGGWSWRYRVIDAEGRGLGVWEIPGGEGEFRPAGGFTPVWLPGERSFLAQAYGAGRWEVRRFFLGSARTVRLAEGFSILLAPDGERFASDRQGIVTLVEVASGREQVVTGGRPLGWAAAGDALLVERDDALLLVPIADPAAEELIGDSGPYGTLRWSPDGSRYAYTTSFEGVSAVFLHARDHAFIGSYRLSGLAPTFDWLDDARLVLELVREDGDLVLSVFDPASGSERDLVDSLGVDLGPRRLP